jgi:hypothetical protein
LGSRAARGRAIKYLAIAAAAIVLMGLLVNVWMLHAARKRLTPSRVGQAALVSILSSVALATGVVHLLWTSRCDAMPSCDYSGLLEGEMTWPGIWLVIYAAGYLAVASLVARLQRSS